MYRKVNPSANQPEKFELPFEGKLASDNRWVLMAELIRNLYLKEHTNVIVA
jgi:hypothetical protein